MAKEERIQELREKMARIMCCFAKDNKSCSECRFPDCFPDIRDQTDQIFTLIKEACYLKAEVKRLPSSGEIVLLDPEPYIAGFHRGQEVMLTPDSEGRVWASVYKEW